MDIKNKFSDGYKRFESKARSYLNKPEKTKELISKAGKKAVHKKNLLQDVWEQLHLLFDLVTAWRKGEYRQIPTRSILLVIATIIYFVTPIDIIPDFLIGFGIVDDVAVISYTLKQISSDLENYKIWKDKNNSK